VAGTLSITVVAAIVVFAQNVWAQTSAEDERKRLAQEIAADLRGHLPQFLQARFGNGSQPRTASTSTRSTSQDKDESTR